MVGGAASIASLAALSDTGTKRGYAMENTSATIDDSTPDPDYFQLDSGALTVEELKLNLDIIENCPPVKAFIDGVVRERFTPDTAIRHAP